MRIVIALGGNALLRRSDPMTTEVQRRNVAIAAQAIAPLAAEHSIVVVHGNGPQVGLLSLQAESYHEAEPYPLDVLDAGTQGMIGYLIQQSSGAWFCRPRHSRGVGLRHGRTGAQCLTLIGPCVGPLTSGAAPSGKGTHSVACAGLTPVPRSPHVTPSMPT